MLEFKSLLICDYHFTWASPSLRHCSLISRVVGVMNCSPREDQVSAAGEARGPVPACGGNPINDHSFPFDLISAKTDRGNTWPYFCSCPDQDTPCESHHANIRQTPCEGRFQNPVFLKRSRTVRIREKTETLSQTGRRYCL